MDPWADVRLKARACHAEALAASGDRSAAAIVAAATRLRDIEVVPFRPGTRFGPGILGVYERVGPLISIDAKLPPGRREQVVAHEIAHHELHDDPVEAVTSVDAAPGAAARIVGYSHRERREMAADVFSSEFLCPADDWLRGELVDQGRRPSEIAVELGLPAHVVAKQAVRSVCLPPLRAPTPHALQAFSLDPAQREAATWSGGSLLVDAGPGTGKTATLAGRIEHLLSSGISPSSILVLTFSVKAAAELRARVAAIAPMVSESTWIGTLHAFGLEVVHGWHHRAGYGPRPRILDRDGALDLLERNLDALPLTVFRDLRDPAAGLAPVLRVMERCKDELVTPEDYASAARAAALNGEGDAVTAAVEVAGIYAAYQRLLQQEGALDLGDLVAVAARLMTENDDIALHYGARFSHVLVDEVQDLNHAATRLLQALCGPGTSLWAVGDGRQSIYRFRGARPGIVAGFAETFGGTTLALDRNYRATPEIAGAFSSFAAAAMPGGAATWAAQRPPGAAIRRLFAATLPGEVAALRDRIEDLRADGVAYGHQAVLARTHRTLERIGAGLERHGIPISYLGDLFVRNDVRDLLSLLSIGSEPNGIGLVRVATRPPYDVARADVIAAIQRAAQPGTTIFDVLRHPRSVPGISADGAKRLELLGSHLAAAGPRATAWTVLIEWLFETHAASALVDAAAPSMLRVAIYQLLRLATEEGTGRRAFLARIRRIAALAGGRDHGVVAPEAQSEDAVRLSTIHAAKGAEFSAVHLPMVSSRHVPLGHRREACPPPPDLARLAMSPAEHDAEERALFFTALSRARDHLTVSHAKRYGEGRDVRPSPFVVHAGRWVDSRHDEPGIDEPLPVLRPQPPRAAYPSSELDTYSRCPARYSYEVVDGLAAAVPMSGYRLMLRAVLAATRRLEDLAARGTMPSYDDGRAALASEWGAKGPLAHAHERALRAAADRIVARLTEIVATEVGAVHHRGEWAVDVGSGIVLVRPHRVVEHPWGAVTVQMMGTHRGGTTRNPGLVAALSIGARSAFPDARVTVEMIGPDDGEVGDIDPVDDDIAIERYSDAIAGIERGDFRPAPGPACPSCPFFFVCEA